MKKKKAVIFALVCVSSVAAILAVAYSQGLMHEYEQEASALPEGFTVTAHTGSAETADNSIMSIRYAGENADVAEFDLHFTREGVPVLSHDTPVGGEVTLDEAFATAAEYDSLKVNVDVKSDVNLAEVKALAEKHGILGRIFFTGIDSEERAKKVKETCPGVEYYLNVDVEKKRNRDSYYLLSLAKRVKDCGAVGINLNKDSASKELCEVFRKQGLLTSIWTADSELDIHKILSFAPDNITSRRPVRVKEIILGIKNS